MTTNPPLIYILYSFVRIFDTFMLLFDLPTTYQRYLDIFSEMTTAAAENYFARLIYGPKNVKCKKSQSKNVFFSCFRAASICIIFHDGKYFQATRITSSLIEFSGWQSI